MSKNFKDFSEMTYQKSIDGCIRDVDKTPFKDIECVQITKSELDKISSLDDIKNHADIVNTADKRVFSTDKSGHKVLVSGKQINGYYVVVEFDEEEK